jgi:non-lysosomal glucosylceramidase
MAYQVTMERHQKPRSGIAMGGLGCGWFELRQDGQFYNWSIFNNRPVGLGSVFQEPPHSVLFFLVRYQVEGSEPRICLLQIEESHGAAGLEGHEFQYIFPWLGGVDRIVFSASFPFATLTYAERDLPVEVVLKAWSPFIPRNAKDSALPAAFFDFSLRSKSGRPVDVSLLASMRNWTGYDVQSKAWANRIIEGDGFRAFEMSCTGMDVKRESFGSMGIASLSADSRYSCGWGHPHPYYERLLRETGLPDLDDTMARNAPYPATGGVWAKHKCFSTIGRTVRLEKAGDTLEHTFVATWDFPNRICRKPGETRFGPAGYLEASEGGQISGRVEEPHNEGHYYSNYFHSSADVAAYAVKHIARLREETRKFHDAYFDSSLPGYVVDQVNSNLNTFRTSSWFTRDGNFGIMEGLSPTKAFAGLSTMDVAMYGGISTAALFPELEKAFVRSHLRFQNKNGSVLHSIGFNYRDKDPREATSKRLDMPAQYAVMALRAGLWQGDRGFLAEVWPSVKRALEYGLRERDHDGDGLPDMEGIMCSYDNFPMHGVAPYVATQWLAAYATAVEAAGLLGDREAVVRFRDVLQRGTASLEAKAWNGSYYRLYAKGTDVDEGCLSDQIIGQWAMRLLNLAPFLKADRVQSALRSIMRMNYRDDQGLRNCQWPQDVFLHDVDADCWVDQANTCWTGVELAFASLLIYEGLVSEGLAVIRNVDERYRRWGIYWDHQEFGGHYFRPMSAWGVIHAALGFSSVDGVVTFDPKVTDEAGGCRLFFTTADGYGRFEKDAGGITVRVISGRLRLRQLRIKAERFRAWALVSVSVAPETAFEDDFLVITFAGELTVSADASLVFAAQPAMKPILQPV